jgi:hypothetical protein
VTRAVLRGSRANLEALRARFVLYLALPLGS